MAVTYTEKLFKKNKKNQKTPEQLKRIQDKKNRDKARKQGRKVKNQRNNMYSQRQYNTKYKQKYEVYTDFDPLWKHRHIEIPYMSKKESDERDRYEGHLFDLQQLDFENWELEPESKTRGHIEYHQSNDTQYMIPSRVACYDFDPDSDSESDSDYIYAKEEINEIEFFNQKVKNKFDFLRVILRFISQLP